VYCDTVQANHKRKAGMNHRLSTPTGLATWLLLAALAVRTAAAGGPQGARLSEGEVGVAARYSADVGLEKKQAVVSFADFKESLLKS